MCVVHVSFDFTASTIDIQSIIPLIAKGMFRCLWPLGQRVNPCKPGIWPLHTHVVCKGFGTWASKKLQLSSNGQSLGWTGKVSGRKVVEKACGWTDWICCVYPDAVESPARLARRWSDDDCSRQSHPADTDQCWLLDACQEARTFNEFRRKYCETSVIPSKTFPTSSLQVTVPPKCLSPAWNNQCHM